MIESQTVFVLGAGANCSYGFPSGETLKTEVVQAVENSLRGNNDFNFLNMAAHNVATNEQVQSNRCKAFIKALSNAGQASIDAFLNTNKHQVGFDVIGKGAIAQVLLRYEQNRIQESDDDWLGYLFKEMLNGINSPEQFLEKNKVGFITFNYDRYLEHWLFNRIRHSFGVDLPSALKILKKIPIYHVYGSLGEFHNSSELNPISSELDPHYWVQASINIRTIFDVEKDHSVIDQSKKLLNAAHKICLLGFGFHSEDIELLDLVSYAKKCAAGNVFSSRYQILEIEWERFSKPFASNGVPITASNYRYKCLHSIRNLPIF